MRKDAHGCSYPTTELRQRACGRYSISPWLVVRSSKEDSRPELTLLLCPEAQVSQELFLKKRGAPK